MGRKKIELDLDKIVKEYLDQVPTILDWLHKDLEYYLDRKCEAIT